MHLFSLLIQVASLDNHTLATSQKNWKTAANITRPPPVVCQYSNNAHVKKSVVSLSSASSDEMIASSSPPPPKVTLNPAGDFSVVVSPSSPELTTTPHTPGAAGDPNARDYKAPLADRPYSEIVDPRLCLTDATGSSTPFTRQAEAALTSNAEVKCILASGNAKRIKSVLRMNHWTSTHMIRETLWKDICLSLRQVYGSIYHDVKGNTLGNDPNQHKIQMPKFVDANTMRSYKLTSAGKEITKNVLCVVAATCPDITFSPIIYSFTSLLLHYQSEEDCYNCLYGILRQKTGGLPQTSIAFDATRYILRDLCKKYAKSLFRYATKKGLQLENIFNQWIFWIFKDLPFNYMIRVVDCFLYEGPKVLYRVAIGILVLFFKHVGSQAGSSGTDIARSIRNFCENIPYTIDALFKVSFSLRSFSRVLLAKMASRSELFLIAIRRANSIIPTINAPCTPYLPTSSPAGSKHHHRDHIGVQELSDVGSSLLTPEQFRRRSRSLCSGFSPIIDIAGEIIASHEWQLLWGWLPTRMTLLQPELVYTTLEHGTSLKTFYLKVDDLEPTLMLIKTTDGDIFGAYCSADWSTRKNLHKELSYFGTGETFVFTLSPQRRRYPWVGVELGEKTPASAHMFMAASKQTLLIGGGGGVAIQLDEDLYKGRTETCDTFNNPLLTAETDFKCATIEVYSFQ